MCLACYNFTEMNCRKQETLGNPKKRKLLKRRKVTFSTDTDFCDAEAVVTSTASSSTSTSTSYTGESDWASSACPQQQHLPVPPTATTWYSPEELDEFKNSTKDQAKRFRLLSNKAVSSAATESSLVLPFRNCGLYKKMKYIVWVQNRISTKDRSTSKNDSSPKTSHTTNTTSTSSHNTKTRKSPAECQFRGLEHRIFFERQRNKTIAMNTVLEFQRNCDVVIKEARNNQRSEREIQELKDQHAKRLSTIYSQLSQWAKDEALAAAHYDASGVYTIPNNSSSREMTNAMARLANKRKAIVSDDDDSSSTTSSSSTSSYCPEDGPQQSFKRARITCASSN